jgi:hypothetical protein
MSSQKKTLCFDWHLELQSQLKIACVGYDQLEHLELQTQFHRVERCKLGKTIEQPCSDLLAIHQRKCIFGKIEIF